MLKLLLLKLQSDCSRDCNAVGARQRKVEREKRKRRSKRNLHAHVSRILCQTQRYQKKTLNINKKIIKSNLWNVDKKIIFVRKREILFWRDSKFFHVALVYGECCSVFLWNINFYSEICWCGAVPRELLEQFFQLERLKWTRVEPGLDIASGRSTGRRERHNH